MKNLILTTLFVFALLGVQQSFAQSPKDAHVVTLDVKPIENIVAVGAPEIEVGFGGLNKYVKGDGDGKLIMTSNVHSPRKVTAEATSVDTDEPQGNISLQVRALDDVNGEATNTGVTRILGFGSTGLEQARDLITSFQTVYKEEIDLQYKAKVNEDYDPKEQTRVQVTYTLTAN